MAVINVDHLAMEIMQVTEIYLVNTVADVKYAVDVVAREAVAELRETAPIGHTGDYADSWSHRLNPYAGKDHHSRVVYSKRPNYGKTHLLEKGHMAVDGSWVAPRQHIAPVEEKAGNWMMDMLTKRIGG